jgi:hypothetical protein
MKRYIVYLDGNLFLARHDNGILGWSINCALSFTTKEEAENALMEYRKIAGEYPSARIVEIMAVGLTYL